MNIGTKIKEYRLSHGLSMNELAKRAKIGQSGLSEIEAGKRGITFDNLEAVVSAMGLTLSEFFTEEPKDVDPRERQLVNAYRKLDDAHKLTLMSTADALLLAEKSIKKG